MVRWLVLVLALLTVAADGQDMKFISRLKDLANRLPKTAGKELNALIQETKFTSVEAAKCQPHGTNTSQKELTMDDLTPILMGAASQQYLTAGCELGLFDLLHSAGKLSQGDIAHKLILQPRAADMLMLGTTSLGLTKKAGGMYFNAPIIAKLFSEGKWVIFKDIVYFEQYLVYKGSGDFTESLRTNTNAGLYNIPGKGRDLYHRFAEANLQSYFYNYMESWTKLTNKCLLQASSGYLNNAKKMIDVGGGTAINSVDIAKQVPSLQVTVLDIPDTAPVAQKRIDDAGLQDRVSVKGGDFFADPFPADHDAILFSHQLVIWTEAQNAALLKKAYDALPVGGHVIIFSSISNDEGTGPLFAALDSVYFASLPSEGGMIYAWYQYEEWLKQAGFTSIEKHNCYAWTPAGTIVATK